MRTMSRVMVVAALAALISIPAIAQTPESSPLIVTEPLDVGGTILQPGNYVIKVVSAISDRNKVQVTSADGSKVFATVLTVPHPLEPGEEVNANTFLYFPGSEGQPKALRTWFSPVMAGSTGGHDIVYEENRARTLARLAESNVVFYPPSAEIETTTLSVVTPTATVETYTVPTTARIAEVTPPVIETETAMTSGVSDIDDEAPDMPATASPVPLMALLGLLSMGGAAAMRMRRRE